MFVDMPSPARFLGLSLLALAVGALPACTRPPSPKPPNVVLVVLDAVAQSHLGLHGYPRDTTPNIDTLAEESHVWDHAYAQAPQTTLSVASLLTGRYPPEAVEAGSVVDETLPRALAANGFRTVAIVENPWLWWKFGIRDIFADSHRLEAGQAAGVFDTPEEIPSQLMNWVGYELTRGTAPVFLYLHILAPHAPYAPPGKEFGRFHVPDPASPNPAHPLTRNLLGLDPDLPVPQESGGNPVPESDRRLLIDRYDENIRFADSVVGELVAFLKKWGQWDNTLLLVTSDHGEAFGEHGLYGHSSTLFDTQIRVPLLIRIPPSLEAGPKSPQRHREVVGVVDIMATILGLLGLAQPTSPNYVSQPLLADTPASRPATASFLPHPSQRAMINASFKLIETEDGRYELYDRNQDPGETRNLALERPAVVERLRETMSGGIDFQPIEAPTMSDLDESTKLRLRQLGYIE